MLPIPPAFATAMDNDVGQAPAMGASKIGILIPNLRANSCARRTELEFIMLDSLRLTRSYRKSKISGERFISSQHLFPEKRVYTSLNYIEN